MNAVNIIPVIIAFYGILSVYILRLENPKRCFGRTYLSGLRILKYFAD